MRSRIIDISALATLFLLVSCGGDRTRTDPGEIDESNAQHLPIRMCFLRIQPDAGLVTYHILASETWKKTRGPAAVKDPFAHCGQALIETIRSRGVKRDDPFSLYGQPMVNDAVPDFWMEKAVESVTVSGIQRLPQRKSLDSNEMVRRFNGRSKEMALTAISVESPSVTTIVISPDVVSAPKERQAEYFNIFQKVTGAYAFISQKFRPTITTRSYATEGEEIFKQPEPPKKR